jgi:LysR family nitrogen assimilation transcriptional regulator
MELKQLRAFLAVAETGNMTRAADVLHLVQPAISRHIQLLEADVGAPLFERERYGMVLTEAGRTMAEYARRAMLELDRARAVIGEAATAGVSGLVTLGLLPSTVDTLCSRLISAMSAQYPGIRIRIAIGYAGNLLQWLQSGDVDAALLYGVDRATNIQTRPLIEEPLWAVAPVDARLRRSRPVPRQPSTCSAT